METELGKPTGRVVLVTDGASSRSTLRRVVLALTAMSVTTAQPVDDVSMFQQMYANNGVGARNKPPGPQQRRKFANIKSMRRVQRGVAELWFALICVVTLVAVVFSATKLEAMGKAVTAYDNEKAVLEKRIETLEKAVKEGK